MKREKKFGGGEPVDLGLERLLKLHPQDLTSGLSTMLLTRMEPFLLKPDLTEEDQWQYENYWAVGRFINDLEDHSDRIHKKVAGRALRYMRFLGFSEVDLTPEGIRSAKERRIAEADREMEEFYDIHHDNDAQIVDLQKVRKIKWHQKVPSAQDRLERNIRKVESGLPEQEEEEKDEIAMEDFFRLCELDVLMDMGYRVVPSYAEYIRKREEITFLDKLKRNIGGVFT